MNANKHGRFDTEGAADYLGLARNTLEKLRTYGGGPPFIKLGSRVFYQEKDLEKWIEEHRCSSTADHHARQARRL